MKTIVLSSWEQAVAARKLMGGVGAATVLASFALTLAWLLGVENVKWPAVVLTLLAAHAITAHFAFRRIAQLQASLDIKRMTLKAGNRVTSYSLAAGDTVRVDGPCSIDFENAATVRIAR